MITFTPVPMPWLETAVATSLIGAAVLPFIRDRERVSQFSMAVSALSALAAIFASVGFFVEHPQPLVHEEGLEFRIQGQVILAIDELNAPLLPLIALLHFIKAAATVRAYLPRFSYSWSLASEAVRLLLFAAVDPPTLIALAVIESLMLGTLITRLGKPIRVFAIHMALFAVLAAVSQCVSTEKVSVIFIAAAVVVRCGVLPFQTWVTELVDRGPLGAAVMFLAPLSGAYLAVRLLVPAAPDWLLHTVGIAALVTAAYCAGMAVFQRDPRLLFAYLLLSQSSIVLMGIALTERLPLTGALSFWFSMAASLGGFGFMLRAVEARFGRLSLSAYQGLYAHAPMLAICFLACGLAGVGFPGTDGFIPAEVLIMGAIDVDRWIGTTAAIATAVCGIAVLRGYLLLFTGARPKSTISMDLVPREWVAVWAILAVIFFGGLDPQPELQSRYRAADTILRIRAERFGQSTEETQVNINPH